MNEQHDKQHQTLQREQIGGQKYSFGFGQCGSKIIHMMEPRETMVLPGEQL